MIVGLLGAFWLVSMVFVMIPGADWAYAITAGMQAKASQPAIAGLLLGHVTATVVVAAGVGVLVSQTPIALTALTLLGAAYLSWLGLHMVINPPAPSASTGNTECSWSWWMIKGFGVSGLNPKVFLLFLALLPQFTSPTAPWPIFAQMIVLGMAHVVNCGIVYAAVAAGAGAVLRTRPKAARIVGQTSGVIMIALACFLLGEQAYR
jgi:threonine/homoserine/homoserine lactone efflux protein